MHVWNWITRDFSTRFGFLSVDNQAGEQYTGNDTGNDTGVGRTLKRVTLRHIAEETGFSINTVSRALTDKADVSHATRSTILETAMRMGYRPNRLAQGLRSNRTHTLGAIIADLENPYFGGLVKRLDEAARRHEYRIIVQDTNEDYEREMEAVDAMLAEHVDGVAITPVQLRKLSIVKLKKSKLPFVVLGRHFADQDLELDYVAPDDVQGGRLATEHLIGKGHTEIALVGGPLNISSAADRLQGYKQVMDQHDLPIRKALISARSVTTEDGYEVGKALLNRKRLPSAIIAFSDFVSLGVMRAVHEKRLRIPQDIAIVGYDDVIFASCLSVPLTTVRIPRKEMARIAVDILRDKINGKADGARQMKLPVELIVRKST